MTTSNAAGNANEPDRPNLEVNDTERFTDHKFPLIRALKLGGWALVVLTVVSLAGWGWARDTEGIWGVLLGIAIGGGFVLATAASVLATADSSPTTTMAVVLGGWLVKIIVVALILIWLRGFDFYDSTAFGVTTILALVVALGAEVWGVITSRTAYLG